MRLTTSPLACAQAQKAKEKAEEAREAARLEEERKKLQAIYEAEQAKQREKEERIREENAARQRDAAAKKQFADEERRRRREEEEAQREEVKREELDRALRDKLVSPSVARVQGAAPSSPPLTTREGAQSPPVGGDAEGGAAMQSPYVPVARVPSPPIPTMRKSTSVCSPLFSRGRAVVVDGCVRASCCGWLMSVLTVNTCACMMVLDRRIQPRGRSLQSKRCV